MTNWSEVIGVGGPVGGVTAALGLIFGYLLKRRGSETGVVETTKATLEIVRERQREMAEENDDLRRRLSLKDEQVSALEHRERELTDQVTRLQRENDELRTRLDRLEGR